MTEQTATLTCPKCSGPMRTYERNGVNIDQCTECRGIFLDRGELERLVEAEDTHYGGGGGGGPEQVGPGPQAPPMYDDPRYAQQGYPQDRGYSKHGGDSKHGGGYGQRKRRGGFLGDLLDF